MASPQTANRFPWNVSSWNRRRPHWFNNVFLVHGIAVVVIFVDQLTKAYASGFMVNDGVSFGLYSSRVSGIGAWATALFPLMILIFSWFILKKYPIVLGLFQGGAMSNLLDRLLYGGVRDWLTVPVFGLRNNLADWAIVIALAWYGIMELHHGTYIAQHTHST